jgi:hypothetical protein
VWRHDDGPQLRTFSLSEYEYWMPAQCAW